ncbi:MAG: hypothetical protein J4F35_12935 [Candidatus Latescibacteria bacterium]|nr:hypothetical protein [Candidatus Latescibacterota bacterium]
MTALAPRSLAGIVLAVLGGLAPSSAQVEVWHIGKGGLSWISQAETQIGALDVGGALQPLELQTGENLIELLRASGQRFLNGQPRDFTLGGQPRAWSNDGFFNQVSGPLDLLDGDPTTSSSGVFKTAQSQAGATFFWDLGAPFPVNRIRFFPAPDDDAFIKAFELRVNDGENFNDINRPQYEVLRRVEVNRESTVDIEFAPLQGRFLQLLVLSKTVFNIAEFEIYGQGFVPVASYESVLHSFGGPVNYGRLRVHTTQLGTTGDATAAIQMRTGADDSPLSYFRRDRDTGRQEEVPAAEYNTNLPRRTLYRQDPATGELLEELDRADYLTLPIEEQGPVRDFVKGDIRDDVNNWSAWSPSTHIAGTGTIEAREFMQFRIFFDGDAENAVRIDTFQVEFSPGLVSEAVGEVALATDPFPASGLLEVAGGIDTTFTYDIRTEFAAGVAGYRGVRIEAFPPPVFESLQMGDPLVALEDFEWVATDSGFDLFFAPVAADNNQPLRITFRLRLLVHNTPINAYLLGAGSVPPHPIAPGNASELVGTNATNAFVTQAQPELQVALSTAIISPNGDGRNDAVAIDLVLSQFAADTAVAVEIFDLSGRRVRQLVSQPRSAGFYAETWDGRDEQGALVAPGLYLCRVGVEADFDVFAAVEPIGVAY